MYYSSSIGVLLTISGSWPWKWNIPLLWFKWHFELQGRTAPKKYLLKKTWIHFLKIYMLIWVAVFFFALKAKWSEQKLGDAEILKTIKKLSFEFGQLKNRLRCFTGLHMVCRRICHGLLYIWTELLPIFSHMRRELGTQITPRGWIFWTMIFII